MEQKWINKFMDKKAARTKKGLAAAMSVDPSRISDIIKGTRNIFAYEIPIIAKYLNITDAAALAYLNGTEPSSDEEHGEFSINQDALNEAIEMVSGNKAAQELPPKERAFLIIKAYQERVETDYLHPSFLRGYLADREKA